jgi:hypothetical protein
MTEAQERLDTVLARIRGAAERAGRRAEEVQLVGVSKLQSAAAVAELFRVGCRQFGENYVQEARDKQALLEELHLGTERPSWHLIGPLQSNKARLAVQLFDWVQTVDRPSLAEQLSKACRSGGRTLQVLVQVNTSGEATKHGVAPEGAIGLCSELARLPGLQLRGLMCVPEPREDPEQVRPEFRTLAELLHEARDKLGLPDLTELSMGMSGDLEVAVEEGATLVRVGTALFGPRPQS